MHLFLISNFDYNVITFQSKVANGIESDPLFVRLSHSDDFGKFDEEKEVSLSLWDQLKKTLF